MSSNNNGSTGSSLGCGISDPATTTAPEDVALPIAEIKGHHGTAFWNLDRSAHALITGPAGSGKSVALAQLRAEAARCGIVTFRLDPNGPPQTATVPGPQRIARTDAEIVEVIEHLHELMVHRYGQLKRGELGSSSDLAPIVVLIDDVGAVLGRSRSISAERLSSLIARGRSVRIHLCLAAQRAGDVPTQMRDNIQFRFSLTKITQADAIQVWGDAHTGTELPSDVPGRGIITTPDGPKEAQVYQLPNPGA